MDSSRPAPEYGGFWLRVVAVLIDSILISVLIAPITFALTGKGPTLTEGGPLNFLVPAIAIIAFWQWKSATPGKLLLKLEIVDAKTLGKPTLAQWLLRYLGYVVSAVVLLLGYLWVAIDDRKQGWHDKIAGTLVVRRTR
jgi:uncharacterized RDD family membrane protein YckC